MLKSLNFDDLSQPQPQEQSESFDSFLDKLYVLNNTMDETDSLCGIYRGKKRLEDYLRAMAQTFYTNYDYSDDIPNVIYKSNEELCSYLKSNILRCTSMDTTHRVIDDCFKYMTFEPSEPTATEEELYKELNLEQINADSIAGDKINKEDIYFIDAVGLYTIYRVQEILKRLFRNVKEPVEHSSEYKEKYKNQLQTVKESTILEPTVKENLIVELQKRIDSDKDIKQSTIHDQCYEYLSYEDGYINANELVELLKPDRVNDCDYVCTLQMFLPRFGNFIRKCNKPLKGFLLKGRYVAVLRRGKYIYSNKIMLEKNIVKRFYSKDLDTVVLGDLSNLSVANKAIYEMENRLKHVLAEVLHNIYNLNLVRSMMCLILTYKGDINKDKFKMKNLVYKKLKFKKPVINLNTYRDSMLCNRDNLIMILNTVGVRCLEDFGVDIDATTNIYEVVNRLTTGEDSESKVKLFSEKIQSMLDSSTPNI